MNSIILFCRAGFEKDCANEITYHAANKGIAGFVRTKANSALVVFECYNSEDAERAIKQIAFNQLVFARQWFCGMVVNALPVDDRVSALLEYCDAMPLCGNIWPETADTNEAKELTKLAKKLSVPLANALRKRNKLTAKLNAKKPVFHLLMTKTDEAIIGYSWPNNHSTEPMGIMRLKFPSQAPSRSTLKLDEAFHVFLTPEQREVRVQGGMYCVDLGACPGGWTYQLVRRGMFVQAVDNGMMADSLMETGQVKHFQEDGFKFRPYGRRQVTWLVCDMVEKPDRVAKLMCQWLIDGTAIEAMFNLKLPMKQRFETVLQCFELIHDCFKQAGLRYELQAKHLYHDREEITVHLRKAP